MVSGRMVGFDVHLGMPYETTLRQAELLFDELIGKGLEALRAEGKIGEGWKAGKCRVFVEVVDKDGQYTETKWTLSEWLKRREQEGWT
jgi:hypothetical protein